MSCYCICCGMAFSNPRDLLASGCNKSSTKRHVLYEGAEKSVYTCKYCGRLAPAPRPRAVVLAGGGMPSDNMLESAQRLVKLQRK